MGSANSIFWSFKAIGCLFPLRSHQTWIQAFNTSKAHKIQTWNDSPLQFICNERCFWREEILFIQSESLWCTMATHSVVWWWYLTFHCETAAHRHSCRASQHWIGLMIKRIGHFFKERHSTVWHTTCWCVGIACVLICVECVIDGHTAAYYLFFIMVR